MEENEHKTEPKVEQKIELNLDPKKASSNWAFQADLSRPFDPLLECLLLLSKFNNKVISSEALVAGLPLVDHRLTPELFSRAAARIGLSAKIVKCQLNEISPQQLPAVLFLKDSQACILQKFTPEGLTEIIQPESGEGYENLSLEDLAKLYTGFAIFVKPIYNFGSYEDTEQNKPSTQNWFWGVMRKAMPIYGEVIVASLLINIFTLASPLFVMNVYDRVVPNNAIETLWVLAVGVIIVFAFDFILRNLRAFFIDFAGKKIDIQLSSQTFAQLLDMQMSARPASMGSLTNTVHAFEFFRDFITSATVGLIIDVPFSLLFIAVMALLGGAVALVPLILMPIMLLISVFMQLPLNSLIQQSHSNTSESHAVLIESLVGAETIKCLRAQGLMQRKWEALNESLAKFGVKMRALANVSTNAAIYIQQIATVLIVIVGVYKITSGTMTMGALIGCVILSSRTLSPVAQVAVLLTKYKQSKNSLDSLNKVMTMPVERPVGKIFLHRPELQGNIDFKEVNFSYPNQIIPALSNITFSVKHGERLGIIGRIGSGKTTIEKLLLKLYSPTSGSILIDGTEIQQLDPAELRHYIGYVPQDVVLFHGSIRDNIVIGAPYVDDIALVRASKLSGIDQFVNQHPEGFDRQVYERGENLSGGQRQAIALARALLLDPPILIFDEPCNSMDEATIGKFLKDLNEFAKNKTLVLVTHKLSLLQLVERLMILDESKIIIDGPRDEVLQKLTEARKTASAAREQNLKKTVLPNVPNIKVTAVKQTDKGVTATANAVKEGNDGQ